MMKKIFVFVGLAFLAVPFASFAQSLSRPETSIESLSVADVADDSIVVLSQDETDIPGYIHQKYAFRCLGELRLVDYYGPAFEPNNQDVLQFERTLCVRQKMNDYDGSSE